MAHYAEINENNKVINIIKIDDELLVGDNGQEYMNNVLGVPGTFIKTSYNTFQGKHKYGGTPFRGNFAMIGGYYDAERDVFLAKQPYPSWILNETTYQWEPPVPMPEVQSEITETPTGIAGQSLVTIRGYKWNENIQDWEVTYTKRLIQNPLD